MGMLKRGFAMQTMPCKPCHAEGKAGRAQHACRADRWWRDSPGQSGAEQGQNRAKQPSTDEPAPMPKGALFSVPLQTSCPCCCPTWCVAAFAPVLPTRRSCSCCWEYHCGQAQHGDVPRARHGAQEEELRTAAYSHAWQVSRLLLAMSTIWPTGVQQQSNKRQNSMQQGALSTAAHACMHCTACTPCMHALHILHACIAPCTASTACMRPADGAALTWRFLFSFSRCTRCAWSLK